MRALLLFLALTLPLAAAAKPEKKLNLKPQPVQDASDPGSATHLIYETPKDSEKVGAEGKPKFVGGQNCTDSMGMIVKPGDAGYTACQRTQNLTKPESTGQHKSLGINIGR